MRSRSSFVIFGMPRSAICKLLLIADRKLLRQRGFEVGFEELAIPTLIKHEVHVNAIARESSVKQLAQSRSPRERGNCRPQLQQILPASRIRVVDARSPPMQGIRLMFATTENEYQTEDAEIEFRTKLCQNHKSLKSRNLGELMEKYR